MSPIDRARARSDALQTLGLSAAATLPDIRKSYRKLAFDLHPDQENGDEIRFMEVTAAYEYLKTEIARRPQLLDEAAMEPKPAEAPKAEKPARAPLRNRKDERRGQDRREEDRVHIDRRQEDRREDDDWTLVGRQRPEQEAGTFPAEAPVAEAPVAPPVETSPPRSRLHEKFEQLDDEDIARCRDALDAVPVEGMTDHVPAAVSRRGRRMSVHIETRMARGANRVAIPMRELLGRKASAQIVVFSSGRGGEGVVDLPEATLAEMFPGVRELKLHFGAAQVEDAA